MSEQESSLMEHYAERPRKSDSPSGPPGPVSTHKRRSVWFQAREAWPLRESPVGVLTRERARAAADLAAAAGSDRWSAIGPSNIGGRMTCVVCDPDYPERAWAGAAGGGVWHSVDAGESWRALWHDQRSLNVGSLALDPHDATDSSTVATAITAAFSTQITSPGKTIVIKVDYFCHYSCRRSNSTNHPQCTHSPKMLIIVAISFDLSSIVRRG